MAQRLSHALARPLNWLRTHPRLAGPLVALLALALLGLAAAARPVPATCQGLCQCWYCPNYHWGDDDGNGVSEFYCDSACDTGCVGSCAYNDSQPHLPGTCSQVPGQGGCGPVCSCRSSDCTGGPVPTENPPTPVITPEPTPPPGCPDPGETREWTNIIPPTIGQPTYKPDYPVVVDRDPNGRGFDLHLVFAGGRYEHKTQRLEQVCDDVPPPAPGAICRVWHYECPIRCAECYDDPLAAAQVRMRLADPTVDWIQKELAQRYPGAQPKEGLPRTWQIAGVRGRMQYDAWWRYGPRRPDVLSNGPVDPGTHGGKLVVWTTGTPKSPPQVVERPFEVPVYLLDTTIAK